MTQMVERLKAWRDRFAKNWFEHRIADFRGGVILGLAIAAIWDVAILWEALSLREEYRTDVVRYAINQLTFTLGHHLFFAAAIGLFFYAIDKSHFRNVGAYLKSMPVAFRWIVVSLLVVSFVVAAGLLASDAIDGPLDPVMFRSGRDSERAIDFERRLRKLPDHPSSENLTIMDRMDVGELISAYSAHRLSYARQGAAVAISGGNAVAAASAIVTSLFVLLQIGMFYYTLSFWIYGKTGWTQSLPKRTAQLLVASVSLFVPWFPLRYYASWYQQMIFGPFFPSPPFWILLIFISVYLFCIIFLTQGPTGQKVISYSSAVAGVAFGIAVKLTPGLLLALCEGLKGLLEWSSWSLVFISVMLVIVLFLLVSPFINADPPDTRAA